VGPQVPNINDPFQILHSFKGNIKESFFMEVIIIMIWRIWMTRNDLIFNQQQPSLEDVKSKFKHEFPLLKHIAKRSYFLLIDIWLDLFG
jgi:hypothetical protein